MSMSDPINHISAVTAKVAAYVSDFLAEPSAFRGQLLRGGGPVAEFEALLADRCGFRHCVATSNATTALMGLSLALGLRGRTVWFPQGHWEGSVSAFRLIGSRIRRYEPGNAVNSVPVKSDSRRGLVIGGNDSENFSEFGMGSTVIIEDSNRLPGITVPVDDFSKADIQVLSFGPGKALSLGEGGAVLFRRQKAYESFVRVAQHPERVVSEFGGAANVEKLALNGRIHPISAILGIGMLQCVDLVPEQL